MARTEDFLDRVREAAEGGKFLIGVNLWSVNRPGSRFYKGWESSAPAIVLLGLTIFVFVEHGWVRGLLNAVGSLVVFFWLVRKWVVSRVTRRVHDYALSDTLRWAELWRKGLLSIQLTDDPEVVCVSPEGDWEGFVREHMSMRSISGRA